MNDLQRVGKPPEVAAETLLIGIGNSGRCDDGLGWAFLDRVHKETAFPGRAEYRYQLQVEDAALVSGAARVVFVDSCTDVVPQGFRWQVCEPSPRFEFTTHALTPQAIMYLCRALYGKAPRAYLLLICGTSWKLRTGLSPEAGRCLDQALSFFREQALH